ncbi:MAG: hypothetical protein HZA22_07810 [Nitrospirae bacterium]|nr:hypothetical protein [Nitrospirota bacterium]
MKTNESMAKKCLTAGLWAGLAGFAVLGLLQGAAIGGTAGLVLANEVFGSGAIEIAGASLISRVVIGASMLAGALVSFVMFMTVGGVAGWAVGRVLSPKQAETKEAATQAR